MRRHSRAGSVALLALAAVAVTASSQLPLGGGTADLAVNANVRVDGAREQDRTGTSVAPMGDLNGDGRADFAIGAPTSDDAATNAGTVFVVFGPATPSTFDLGALGTNGYRINGANPGDRAGLSVANAGDVNGDRRNDLVIGAPLDDDSGLDSGTAYVVFGRGSAGTINLDQLGNDGFRIEGPAANARFGTAVGAAGDVNGDGLGDVIGGAPVASANNRSFSGSAFVVFGRATTATVDLSTDAQTGRFYRVDGAAAGDSLGSAVTTVGDTNGDGRADVVIGAPGVDVGSDADAGAAYVIHGQGTSLTVDASGLGGAGFRYTGASRAEQAGSALFPTDDLNGDGRADLLVGAPGASRNDREQSGSTYVVFSPGPGGGESLGSAAGFRVDGAASGDRSGTSVAPTGDVSGDGRSDVIIGAPGADNSNRGDSGSAYIVHGVPAPANVDLASLGTGGVRIDGGRPGDFAGTAVSGAGDVNRDGGLDVLVGAPNADNNARINSGAVYSVFGYPPGSVTPPAPPAPPPPPSPPAAPFVQVTSTTVRLSRSGTAVVRMRCNLARPDRCRGSARLRSAGRVPGRYFSDGEAREVVFGRALINIRFGSRGAAVIPLSSGGRTILGRARRLRVRITVTPPTGPPGAAAARTFTLQAPRR